MNTRTSYVAIAILAAVFATSTSTVFAQGSFDEQACPNCEGGKYGFAGITPKSGTPITIWTDEALYDHESKIVVEGTVAAIRVGADIGL